MTSDGHGTVRHLHHLVVAMLLLAVGACASQPPDVPRQYLDQQSAATVTVATGALVFARERPELAVHARDYLTLVPVDVNQAGTHRLYFYCHVWSTIDKRGQPGNDDGPARFELVADGRQIPLVPVEASIRELGLAEPPVRAPSPSARLLVAATDRDALEFLASASELRAIAHHGGASERYELWKDGRQSLLSML